VYEAANHEQEANWMKRFFKRTDKLEVRLRDERPQPKDELVERITNETSAHRRTSFRPALRPQLAIAFTVVALGAAVALGALVGIKGEGPVDASSAKKQYGNKVTICHRPPGNPGNAHTIRVGEPAARAHLRNHPGDTPGPCPSGGRGAGGDRRAQIRADRERHRAQVDQRRQHRRGQVRQDRERHRAQRHRDR
jgi:hypothetical protein